ncbi:hypothetical protein BgiBS90_028018 [Biomphalaria glabrata]|nr:hypothetical protein BgiBS90_028018 [Biomphalaria glabrata]
MENPQTSPTDADVTRNVGEISLNDIRDAFTSILGLELTHKTVFIVVCACLLTGLTLQTGTSYTSTADVFVYCTVYSSWVTLCLPWLVQNMDGKMIKLVASIFLRLFGADIGVLTWKAIRGQSHIFHRGLRMRPLFEPSMSWLSEAGYNLRYGVVIAALVASGMSFSITIYRKYFRPSPRVATKYSNTDLDYEESLASKTETGPNGPTKRDGSIQEGSASRNLVALGPSPALHRRSIVKECASMLVVRPTSEPPMPTGAFEKSIMKQGMGERVPYVDTMGEAGRQMSDFSCMPGIRCAPLAIGAANQGRPHQLYGSVQTQDFRDDQFALIQPEAISDVYTTTHFLKGEGYSKGQVEGDGTDYVESCSKGQVGRHNTNYVQDAESSSRNNLIWGRQFNLGSGVSRLPESGPRTNHQSIGVLRDAAGFTPQPGLATLPFRNSTAPMTTNSYRVGSSAMSERPDKTCPSEMCGDGRVAIDASQRISQNLQGAKRRLQTLTETLVNDQYVDSSAWK